MTNPDLIALANELDDIETDAGGKCNWSEVATVSDALRRLASSDGGVKGEPEPVAWQYRYRPRGSVEWSDWGDCGPGNRAPKMRTNAYEIEERPLFLAPPADAGMREALENVRGFLDTPVGRLRFAGDPFYDEVIASIRKALTAPGATTKSDVEALAATTAERPGTVTSEPEPSTSDPSSIRSDVTVERGIYIASKTKHADRWKRLRSEGVPIISTWIDEAGAGETSDFHDLWRRCLTESANCAVLVSYREPGEVLKGGWVEIGAALAKGVPVYAVGLEEFTIASYRGITHFPTIEAAIEAARALLDQFEIRRK